MTWRRHGFESRLPKPTINNILIFAAGAALAALLTAGAYRYFDKPPVVATVPVAAEPQPVIAKSSQSEILLDVPSLKQEYRQSCEAASLRMALQYRGVEIDDWSLLQMFGYKPTHRSADNKTWDNPYKQFVGDVRGAQDKGEGYGVYAPAVAKVGPKVGRELVALSNTSAKQIAEYIYDGNPVVIWGYYNAESKADSWKTKAGKTIPAVMKAHVRLAYGVKGPADKPTGFYIRDPLIVSDKPQYWTTAVFMDHLKKFGKATDQAVVVM